ncbi:hypothetical protein SMD11_0531 [Streptomyces albireticuli]|uniref:Uncharacterized protein n=1 Tax=Streptomyces albireticuli TaxID=1940 RepID=A0A1Z2KVW7_9ACTN|nr:hypothetical protein SMD11_0531 [Streptomyces albireticuli]
MEICKHLTVHTGCRREFQMRTLQSLIGSVARKAGCDRHHQITTYGQQAAVEEAVNVGAQQQSFLDPVPFRAGKRSQMSGLEHLRGRCAGDSAGQPVLADQGLTEGVLAASGGGRRPPATPGSS